jgi:glycosyltransferase involved in cell wall biosynthesis
MTGSNVPAGNAAVPDVIGPHSISVIVPTYNRSLLVVRAIRSILAQAYRPAEIIVIDDCSSDDTQGVIAAYAGDVPLVSVRLAKNGGGAVARNAGIVRAKGDYIAFLDSDDEWQPDHLRVLMRAAVRQLGDFVIAGSALRIGKKPRVLPGRDYPERRSVAVKLQFVLSAALAFQTSTLLMPRETALRFMFDPHLRRHQDWDLVFRMIKSGVAIVLLSDATTRYYTPQVENAANVGISRSLLPSVRFLAKHKASMSAKTKARFVALQIMRRRGMGIGIVRYLLYAMMLGGMSVREFVYYTREALLAGPGAALKRKFFDAGGNSNG